MCFLVSAVGCLKSVLCNGQAMEGSWGASLLVFVLMLYIDHYLLVILSFIRISQRGQFKMLGIGKVGQVFILCTTHGLAT